MSWSNRNNTNHGARSKNQSTTDRNTGVKSKKNRNFSECSDESNWNQSKAPATHASSGIWDDEPSYQNNAWNENLVSKMSEREKRPRNIPQSSQNGAWNNIDDDFPALESRPPPVNVWQVRQQKENFKKALEPSNETEEERMLREAIELSKIEVKRDEKKRQELEQEYLMQRHLLETNPSLYAEFYTDDEIAKRLPSNDENEFEYDPASFQSFSENKYQNKDNSYASTLSSKPKQSVSVGNRKVLPNQDSKVNSDSNEKISKVVDMFGGWGKTTGSSQSMKKSSSHKQDPMIECKKPELSYNGSKTTSSSQVKNKPPKKEAYESTHKNISESSSRETQDEDKAWKSDEIVSNHRSDIKVTSKTKDWHRDEDNAWKTSDLESSSYKTASSHMDEEDEDSAWKSYDPEPRNYKTTLRNKDEEYEDSAWKSNDLKPSRRQNKSAVKTSYAKENANKDSNRETEDVDEDIAWKSNDVSLSVYSKQDSKSKKKHKENERSMSCKPELNDQACDKNNTLEFIPSVTLSNQESNLYNKCDSTREIKSSASNKTSSSKYSDNSKKIKQKISSRATQKPLTAPSCDMADSIISDYVNLTSTCDTDNQNSNIFNANEPVPDENVFKILKNDYGLNFAHNAAELNPLKQDEPKELGMTNKSLGSGLSCENNSTESRLSVFDSTSLSDISPNAISLDDDISLPLFASSFKDSDETKISVSDEFRQSFGAHFQQFQAISTTITPVFMNPLLMNPMMQQMAMSSMMQQMSLNPMMQQAGMNPMMQPTGINPMMQQMGLNPMMNPMMSSISNPMMQQMGMNPMISPIAANPMLPHMPVHFKQMTSNDISPYSNLPGGNVDLDQFIPPPINSSEFNLGNEIGDSLPKGSIGDDFLDQFLSKPVFGEEPPIAGPIMPQNLSPIPGFNGPSVIPAPRGVDEAACSGPMRPPRIGDENSMPLRIPSRYVLENQKEIRQPASMPSLGRGKR